MMRFVYFLIVIVSSLVDLTSTDLLYAATTYMPGPTISMTGSSDRVYFYVADDIYTAISAVGAPVLHTDTLTFSGAFYLSGAGWVDFSTGSYSVSLDCG
jgi:hypothetical protein